MSNKIWNFPLSNHGQNTGSGGVGDQYKDKPLNHLAREIIQNSMDARPKDSKKPVIVEFHKFTIPTDELPGISDLFGYCMNLYNQYTKNKNGDPKDIAVIDNFIKCIKEKRVSCLRISDYNTTGLSGSYTPAFQNTPWFAFIKGAGKNQKSDSSSGSKGLGKEAIFVNSLLRSIFVSTYSQNEQTHVLEKAWIGIAKMLSLTIEDGTDDPDYTQGVGFCVNDDTYSKEHNSPSKELLEIDPEFDRMSMGFGTDIFVPGFMGIEFWDDIMATEVITSFLPAILDGDLVVKFTYDTTTVQRVIDSTTLVAELTGKHNKEPREIYEVFKSPQTKKIPFTDKPGFEMTLLLLQNNLGGLNGVYKYRNKMKIRMDAVDCSVSYTGALLLTGTEICKRLRSVENAQHSNWSISSYKDSGYTREQIKEAIDEVERFVSQQVSLFGTAGGEEAVYFEVSGWNTEEDTLDMSIGEETEIGLPTEEIVFNRKADATVNPRRKSFKKKGNVIDDKGSAESIVPDIGEPGEGEYETVHPEGHNQGKGGEYHEGNQTGTYDPGANDKQVMARRSVATVNARMPSVSPEDGVFDLVFKPEKSGTEVDIEILKAGVLGENEPTRILSAKINGKDLKIENNKILMDEIEKGKEYRINLVLDEETNYIWEVNVNAKD